MAALFVNYKRTAW